jgi:hypothetical protein
MFDVLVIIAGDLSTETGVWREENAGWEECRN